VILIYTAIFNCLFPTFIHRYYRLTSLLTIAIIYKSYKQNHLKTRKSQSTACLKSLIVCNKKRHQSSTYSNVFQKGDSLRKTKSTKITVVCKFLHTLIYTQILTKFVFLF